ncbi:hypothetical protein [Ekhidna sp.]|uniref:hypothetical protein n=1 Tax=Ekhidna sp. TaxID=2608089 RepID=UPI0032ED773F
MKKKFVFAIISTIIILSCKENNSELIPVEGTYSGVFNVHYDDQTNSGETRLSLQSGKFECDGNPDRIPAGGSGTYKVEANTIIFRDENVWTADFDWGLILSGEYTYSFDGSNLILIKTNGWGKYEYLLKLE